MRNTGVLQPQVPFRIRDYDRGRFDGRLGDHHGYRGSYGNPTDVTKANVRNETRKLPQCIIIGVRKGGTRALLDFLEVHPGIKSAGREIHFFDTDENYNLGLDWYRSMMPPSSPGQITIEKTPKYFVSPRVPERIAKMNGSIKLILIVRDPLERSISDFAQLKKSGKGPREFEGAAINYTTGNVTSKFRPILYSLYYVHLRHWLKHFKLEQMLVLNSENFVKNPTNTLSQIETFLNLKHVLTREQFYFNETKGFYCLKEQTGLRGKKRKQAGCMGSFKGIEHPNISAVVSEKIRTFFRPFNEVFFKTIGEDFHWH
ncbi:heparan sulfate glucosamine 3-O-sulfotransferase 5-like [Lineus longissimus]|uniref:heparan sulfate glucosamine 3-O-sulfotransferase 5-like n=1 Tax=Lineus longissimus TaxID=88925 RepID=UPI00315D18C5